MGWIKFKTVFKPIGENGERELTPWGEKCLSGFLFAVALAFSIFYLVKLTGSLPKIWSPFGTVIRTVIKLFREPAWVDLLEIIFSVFIGIIVVSIALFFLGLSVIIWKTAFKYNRLDWIKRLIETPAVCRIKHMWNAWMEKMAPVILKIIEYLERDRDERKDWFRPVRNRLNKPIPWISGKDIKTSFFPHRLLQFLFWSSLLGAWVCLEYISLTAFYLCFMVSAAGFIIALTCHSLSKTDYLVLLYLKDEIKDMPKIIGDFWKEAYNSVYWTFPAIFLYLAFIEKLNFRETDFTIIITRVGAHFLRIYVIVYCIKIVIYSARKIGGSKAAGTLGGISASMMLAAGYYEGFLPDVWGRVVFWIYYSLGFIASFFTIRFSVKKLPLKRDTMNRKRFITLFVKFVAIVMFSAIILQMLFGFLVLGIYPGASDISEECSINLRDATDNFFKSTDVFNEFKKQFKKGLEKADFSMIKKVYTSDPYFRKAVESFKALKKNAMHGREYTWHRFNLYGMYYWYGDSMVSISDYMYKALPELSQYLQEHGKKVKDYAAIFEEKSKDLNALEKELNSKQHREQQQIIRNILIKVRRCNDLYESLEPRWMWRMVPNLGKFHVLMLNIEARVWIFLNYINLKTMYKDEYIIVRRSEVILHGHTIDNHPLSRKFGTLPLIPFDHKIMLYSGFGKLH